MNKGELRSHMLALLNRSDCTDALADTFIDQAIARIERTLRVPSMEQQHIYTIDSASGVSEVFIPSNFIEMVDIHFDGRALVRLPNHEMVEAQKTGSVGNPEFFCRVQGTLQLHPKPTIGSLYLNYYGEFDALVDDGDTNSLTVIASDLIVYTALGYASDYFLDERGPLFDQKAGSFLVEIQEQANSAETSGTVQVMRPTHRYED